MTDSPSSLNDIVKAYDIRGLVGEQIDARVCQALGSAFAHTVVVPDGHEAVVIGHDMRPSSPELAEAFASGVKQHGVDVVDIGLCSTDGLYYASGALDLPGAMFTASHNPAEYNGIKLCRPGARPVGTGTGLEEVRDLAAWLLDRGHLHESAVAASPAPARGSTQHRDVLGAYADHLHSLVDLSTSRPLRVVVDAGNGMAGLTVPAVLADGVTPVSVIPLYFELDGSFPNHPANPLEEANVSDLQVAVVREGADLGLAFDGDADRCAVVDERGHIVSASAITALVAAREITKQVAAGVAADQVRVVYSVTCSAVVPEVIAEHGATGVRSRVGHSFVKAEMAAHQAVFGGEHSAHYYFRDFWYADTGMLAALHILAALGGQTRPLSEVMAPYQRYPSSGELNSVVPDVEATTEVVQQWGSRQGASADLTDGLTLTSGSEPYWRANLRPSNTEPLLRLTVEAADVATMEQIRDELLDQVRAR